MTVVNNQNSPSQPPKAPDDNCLLPPLNHERSAHIAATQLHIPGKVRKEYQRACSALTKKKVSDAEHHLRKAVQEYPKYAAAWVTLGQELAENGKAEDGRSACSEAAKADASYLPAYLCQAEIASKTRAWSEELKYTSRALEVGPGESVVAYEYDAAANANLGNLDQAEKSGLRALELDKDHRDPGVYLLLAQIYELRNDAVRQKEQLRSYLKYTHNPERAALVRQTLKKVENGERAGLDIPESSKSEESGELLTQRWGPVDIDKVIPPVLDDAVCPLPEILHDAGQRETELVENLQHFTAAEQVEHTEFNKNGKPRRSTSELFNYLAEIEQNPYEGFWVKEYRIAKRQADRPPLADTATAALALMFHPKLLRNLDIRCEGRTELQGMPAWQLRFEEGPDPSKTFSALTTKHSAYRVRLKGRAWISADNYQVLRLQTDLATHMPEINLLVYHFDVAYAPVESAKGKFQLWLPKTALLQIEYRGRRYQRVHTFSHFQLFQVDTEQKVKEPIQPTPGLGLPSKTNSDAPGSESSQLELNPSFLD